MVAGDSAACGGLPCGSRGHPSDTANASPGTNGQCPLRVLSVPSNVTLRNSLEGRTPSGWCTPTFSRTRAPCHWT